MAQSIGPNTNDYGLVFGFDVGDGGASYKGMPATNLITSGYPGFFGSGGEVITTTSYLGKKSDSGIFLRNVITSPNNGNNGGLYKAFSTATLNPSSRYIQISFDYYGIVPYNRNGYTEYGLNGYLGVTYTDSSNDNYGWDVTYTGGSGDDWNTLSSRMGYWQKISLIVALNPSKNPSSINAMYIYNDFLVQGEGVFTNFIITEHTTYPQGPVEYTSGTRTATQSLFDVTSNGTIDVTNASYNSSGKPRFDGTDDYMTVASYGAIQIVDDLTIETVVKFETSNLGSLKVFANKYHSTGWELILGANGNMYVGGRNGDGTYYGADTGRLVVDGRYHHIVFTKNGLNWKVYVDGTLGGSTTLGTVGTMSNSGEVQLGKEGSSYYTAMTMDVLKIYNRTHLASEIQTNFQRYRKRYSIPYYYEGSNASLGYFIGNWNNGTTYNMAQFGGLGNVTAHGFTSGPVTFTMTLPISHAHTQVRYKVFWHLVDSLDNETNQLFITNQNSEVELLRFTKQYNLVPNISIQKIGVTATWSGHQSYTYRPWGGGGYGQDGYLTIDSGWVPHTGSTLTVRHVMGADQGQSDEAEYLSHVEVDIL